MRHCEEKLKILTKQFQESYFMRLPRRYAPRNDELVNHKGIVKIN
ncbi:hypothetical protein RFEPED_1656 [Rickettsia felis str. Pedreira]|uniref:Uncharacterized protein n=1 Tax=Rickettsia felis str. Pedreira TaxID=1359196 RepID=A0A0F3MUX7_RICFI|nr:hypothetical protein RFEPED_1656 [Rickettsia felis str. Pedreira]